MVFADGNAAAVEPCRDDEAAGAARIEQVGVLEQWAFVTHDRDNKRGWTPRRSSKDTGLWRAERCLGRVGREGTPTEGAGGPGGMAGRM